MVVMRILGRVLAIAGGFILFAFGLAALSVAYLPETEIARVAGRLAIGIGAIALGPFCSSDPREVMAGIQSGFAMRFIATPAGFISFPGCRRAKFPMVERSHRRAARGCSARRATTRAISQNEKVHWRQRSSVSTRV